MCFQLSWKIKKSHSSFMSRTNDGNDILIVGSSVFKTTWTSNRIENHTWNRPLDKDEKKGGVKTSMTYQ